MIIYQQQFVSKCCITVAFTTLDILVLMLTVFALGTNLAIETLSVSTIFYTQTCFLGKVPYCNLYLTHVSVLILKYCNTALKFILLVSRVVEQ